MRNCSDTLLVSTINHSSVEALAEQFSSGKGVTKKHFVEIYYKNVFDYQFLGINNLCTKNNDKSEIYFTIKGVI